MKKPLILGMTFAILVASVYITFEYCSKHMMKFADVPMPNGRELMLDERGVPEQYGFSRDGVKHSEWLKWHRNGLLAARKLYDNGQIINAEFYGYSGNNIAKISEGNGVYVHFGIHRVTQLTEVRNGIASGSSTAFCHDGSIYSVKNLKSLMPHGHQVYLGKEGNILEVEYYEHGIRMSRMRYSEDGKMIKHEGDTPSIFNGDTICGLYWDGEIQYVDYWCEKLDGVWYLRWMLPPNCDHTSCRCESPLRGAGPASRQAKTHERRNVSKVNEK